MRYAIFAITLALSLAIARPAAAWDPSEDPTDEPAPPEWTPEPAPIVPPPGIYLVTETYAGDSVTQAGAVTTYSTETVHETTGSYARVLETVGTGGSSSYDGAAFNGRAAMTDGRAVAGTYYENYVYTDAGFVAVSVVFFQDDSEIARAAAAARPQAAVSAPAPDPAPVFEPVPTPSRATPAQPTFVEWEDRGLVAPAHPAITPSSLLADRSIQVLRARRTTLSLSGADVRGWRLVSGECTALGPLSGTATEPFVARWDRLAPAGSTWIVRFSVDYADGTSHELVVRVAVRAPGLVE
jgi:hypothetical protein